MKSIETDYLVIGAGATGMAFADTLLSETDHEIVIVDRRHQPGGHWVDAYPFVELHQPSAYYGVNSLPLGQDRIDLAGINAGFYERAGAAEIQHYYQRVLEETFLPSGRIQYHASSDYLGCEDDHHIIRSNISGGITRVAVRRALVDASVVQSSIPACHTRTCEAEKGVTVVTPNQLVDIANAKGFTVLGGGKTAMAVCFWLMQQGVAPDDICWVRPRESWMTERSYTQPLSLVANMVKMQAASTQFAAEATSVPDYSVRMEAAGMSVRLDRDRDAIINRGATISLPELSALREIENVVRKGHVRAISQSAMIMDEGDVGSNPGRVYVDCTAAGLNSAAAAPIFEDGKISMHFTTMGVAPWSAAVIGFVETLDMTLEEKNRLCPALHRTGDIYGTMNIMRVGMPAEMARRQVSEIAAWSAKARLNPGRAIPDHMDDPEVQSSLGTMMQNYQPALENIERLCAEHSG
ncbi:NAD(P)-binding protein [Parasphingopyxis sp.]|uniref:NAD(P)-binding protein n=1 Tax=Parasphingopyxis sp. TaxID=1920299 RepID=UPI002618BDEA|nr:NAD(P)-binding protein [Parasphingopyxis sp.]